MNIKKENLDKLLAEKLFLKYKNIASAYENHLIACAGEKHCSFGVIPNKPDAIEMAQYLAQKVPLPSDSKIRMYWSGCVKGCGLHGVGDIGFEGCKAKINGVSSYGVHIFIGGTTSGESKEAKSVLKSIPLKYAKHYVESLAIEYRRLKLQSESFENFYKRVLSKYSHGAIGFYMMLLAYIRKNNLDINIGFKVDVKTGKNENFEIFELGRSLFNQVTGTEPYLMYETFRPMEQRKLNSIDEKVIPVDDTFIEMILLMVKEKNSAIVFSELSHFVEISS